MKKNRAMRLAVLMLVLVMMTSCFVGGTFAKYTSSSTGTATARVAYWGFTAPAKMEIDMFDGEYTNTADVTTVDAKNTDNVIAPGTSKEVTFGFAYTANTAKSITAPEVDYSFTVDATGTASDDIKNNTNIVWYLDGTKVANFDALLTAIEGLSEDVEAGNLPANNGSHTVKWEWAFETKGTDGKADATQDAFDTVMGNKNTLDEVSIEITITATQVD